MTESDAEHAEHAEALLRLLEQSIAGVALIEETLDRTQPGWDAPRKGRRAGGPGGSPRYVLSALHNIRANVGWMLVREFEVEPYRLAPMAMRDREGGYEVWQRGPDGSTHVTTAAAWEPVVLDESTKEPVRSVRRPEARLYTLQEARSLLEGCVEHAWAVDVSEGGEPTGVRCSRPGCEERRPVG